MKTAAVAPATFGSLDDGLIYEYSKAADPLRSGKISGIPYSNFPASLHQHGPSGVIALDLSEKLQCKAPATSPGLSANFVRLRPNETLVLNPNASSQVYFVMRGSGESVFGDTGIAWHQGDVIALPAIGEITHRAEDDTALYWVHDEPMLTYLGATAQKPTFRPAHYRKNVTDIELARVAGSSHAKQRSRISVLLASKDCKETLTITPSLWAMLGIVPPGTMQMPHRHQSVALDLIIECEPGCYTLVGPECNELGEIINPTRVDWNSHAVFVTPPGYWHAHFNESGSPAFLLPIQDAGLQTYLRALDIQFTSG
jgi:gentisate 1,2-dioxygenase